MKYAYSMVQFLSAVSYELKLYNTLIILYYRIL